MATREQVAFRLREYERRESQLNDEGMITLGTLRLALRALDTERDAALGKAVRGEFDVGCARPDRYFDSVANMLGRHPMARDVLRAIAAQLRAEGGA